MSDPSQGTDRRRSRAADNAALRAGWRAVRQNGRTQPAATVSEEASPWIASIRKNATRQPRRLSPPMAFAMPLGARNAGRPQPDLRRDRRNRPETNRGISAVHGLGDAPPLDAPSFWDVATAGSLRRPSSASPAAGPIGSGPAPAVARSGRVTRRQRLAPLRADANSPDARTGLHPFLRPREPTSIRPLGRPALRRVHRQAAPFYRRCPPATLARAAAVARSTSRPQPTPVAAIARLRVKRHR